MLNFDSELEHENIAIKHDRDLGFISIIAIHNTKKGPALGGCRYVSYDTINDAINDALHLSKAMTYKSAMAGLPLGGGKAVIMCYANRPNRVEILKSFGKFVNSLGGIYITASDSGTDEEDMKIIAKETPYVTSIKRNESNQDSTADKTAEGVVNAMRAALYHKLQKNSFKKTKIAIQGAGSVGSALASKLKVLGADIVITDINEELAKKVSNSLGLEYIKHTSIYDVECDIFAPCALGGVIHSKTINRLKTMIICGAANNQLLNEEDAHLLHSKGILYVPDYVANAGGVICAAAQSKIISNQEMLEKLNYITDSVSRIAHISSTLNIPSHSVANEIAEQLFA